MANRLSTLQTTLRESVVVKGIGVHGGQPVSMTLSPAEAGTGIVFRRTDVPGSVAISASIENLSATESSTSVGRMGLSVSTVEHLLATFNGLGVDNVAIEIDGAEVPVMDGSSSEFVALIDGVELQRLAAPRRYIKVLKPVRLEQGPSFAELRPFDGRRFEIDIDFSSPLIGRQSFVIDLTPASFRRDLARARTFGFLRDVEAYWSRGLALGSSLENTVVLGDDKVINPEGLRFADEFVRHKALDAVGDLALAGAPIIGAYRSYRGGHKLNARMVEALLSDSQAYTIVESAPAPRREGVRGEVPAQLVAAAFGPQNR